MAIVGYIKNAAGDNVAIDDLVYRSKKKHSMTFEELKEYVDLHYKNDRIKLATGSDHICFNCFMLTDLGEVIWLKNVENPYRNSPRIRKKISFEQMKLIIDGLYGDLKTTI